ncbi:MAG: TPR end-of-group domain-containing protein [Phycisphaerales bacterium]
MPATRPFLLIGLCLWAFLATAPAVAQEAEPTPAAPKVTVKSMVAETGAAFDRGDYARAEELLRKHLAVEPGNFVVLYNLACARAMQSDPAGAGEWLVKAVESGFIDLHRMRTDPMLDPVREDPNYHKLVDNWPVVLKARRDADVKGLEKRYGKGYATTSDERLRLTYRSAFHPAAFESARAEMTRLAEWADREIMPGILDPEKGVDDPWVSVILPTRDDFRDWISERYGPDMLDGPSTVGGAYIHDTKQLIAMDLGATFRHEFLHILHWRSMSRLGQQHPVWVMEGLCSLVEDYDADAGGGITPATSWRTNLLKRREKINRLFKIEQFVKVSQSKFTSTTPLAHYAQARAIFLFLHQRGKLRDWYAHYTSNFDADPSGLASLTSVLGMTATEFDGEFRAWVKALPQVPEEIRAGMASLGVEVDAGEGEGVVVTRLAKPKLVEGTLRLNDIITAIDEKPVRDTAELVRVLSAYSPGAEVQVSYRRAKKVSTCRVKLIAKPR